MSLDESLSIMIRDAVRAEVQPLAAAVESLQEKVSPERRMYVLEDLWQMLGGKNSGCKTLASFRQRKDLPEADSRNGRRLAYSRQTVDAWMDRKLKKAVKA